MKTLSTIAPLIRIVCWCVMALLATTCPLHSQEKDNLILEEQIINNDEIYPLPQMQKYQKEKFKSSTDLVELQKKLDREVEKREGQELVDYLNRLYLRVKEAELPQKNDEFIWAYSSLIANYSGKTEHYYRETYQTDYYFGKTFLKPPARYILGWQKLENLEEAELFFHYLAYMFRGRNEVVEFGLNLVRQKEDNALLCRSCAWVIAGMSNLDNKDNWQPQLEYFARSVEKSDLENAPFWAAYIYNSLFYVYTDKAKKIQVLDKSISLMQQSSKQSPNPLIVQRAQFFLKIAANDKERLKNEK